MSKIKDLKKVEDVAWKAFAATGDINAYGMIVASRELQREKIQESQQNGLGM